MYYKLQMHRSFVLQASQDDNAENGIHETGTPWLAQEQGSALAIHLASEYNDRISKEET